MLLDLGLCRAMHPWNRKTNGYVQSWILDKTRSELKQWLSLSSGDKKEAFEILKTHMKSKSQSMSGRKERQPSSCSLLWAAASATSKSWLLVFHFRFHFYYMVIMLKLDLSDMISHKYGSIESIFCDELSLFELATRNFGLQSSPVERSNLS